MRELKSEVLLFAAITPLLYGAAFFFIGRTPSRDWGYFGSFSTLIRSEVLHYHVFPIHNPWGCGGMDILSNPQNRIFSPFFLFDLAFNSFNANLLTLAVLSFFGLIGSYLFFQALQFNPITSALSSILFISSSWFGLHFAEGHIVYGTIQLIPFLLWLTFQYKNRRAVLTLFMLYTLIFLSGSIYTIIFSLYATVTCVFVGVGGLNWKELRAFLNREKKFIFLCGTSSLLIGSVKILPTFLESHAFAPRFVSDTLSLADVFQVFFDPFQSIYHPLQSPLIAQGFHEFGNYWGLGVAAIALYGIYKAKNRLTLRILLAMAFWFWTATGWGTPWNPWTLHEFSPFSNAHIQSRVLIIVDLFMLILFSIGFQKIQFKSRFTLYGVGLFLVIEALFVRNYSFYSVYQLGTIPQTNNLIQSTTLTRTQDFLTMDSQYSAKNTGSRSCNEPYAREVRAIASSSPQYRGELYAERDHRFVKSYALTSYVPGTIVANIKDAQRGDILHFNTNHLLGWKDERQNVEIISHPGSLLTVRVIRPTDKLQLKYSPAYLPWIWVTLVLGIILQVYLYQTTRPRKKPKFDYTRIKPGYYHEILKSGFSIRQAWHQQKFERILEILKKNPGGSLLDIGCFSGSFLSMISPSLSKQQLGVDVLEKQIQYANQNFHTEFRNFLYIPNLKDLGPLQEKFSDISAIEVIEHLTQPEITRLFEEIERLLQERGQIIITTPNYLSFWPVWELLINLFSDVSYEEQHLTRFNYFNIWKKLCRIYPRLATHYQVSLKTSSHFAAPFLAIFSKKLADRASKSVDPSRWRFPFGSLIILVIEKRS